MYDCGFAVSGLGWIGTFLWWGVLILAGVWLVRALGFGGSADGPTPGHAKVEMDPALRILRERYARGEIDKDEFDRRRAGLA